MTDTDDRFDEPDPAQFEAPVILDRGRHPISRREIDPDCLKVLYRLSGHNFTAYLVGGAVRDLLVGRRPADFDVGTNAHPNQIKKLFRNAFLIGRRFRLAHIRFQGGKIIEVSTFRRKPDEEELAAERAEEEARSEEEKKGSDLLFTQNGAKSRSDLLLEEPETIDGAPAEGAPEASGDTSAEADAPEAPAAPAPRRRSRPPLKPIAYGTPREDAFRRDLTINALFYDIATFSVIDYVGGLADLEARRIRIIGDPDASYTEDPVRIWRVLRHASRLGFAIEERTAEAIPRHHDKLAACAGSRLYEELNKDLKSGASRAFFQSARVHGILSRVLGEVGELYERSDDRADKLSVLLGVLDASINSGGSPPPAVMYGLLLWPWAEPLLADVQGDKPKVLYDAFRASRPAATVPKTLLLETVHTLVIADHMVQALLDGKMRWALKERPHYAEASRITSVLVDGTFGSCDDPFTEIYRRRFGTPPRSKPHRYRRRKKKVPQPPPPTT
jgi:poly(A) polymerase